MGNELKAGSQKNASLYANSMAQAMEEAFLREWPNVMGGDEKPEVSSHLKLMFVAVAQGVVKHLEENNGAFILEDLSANNIINEKRMHRIDARDDDFEE